MSGVMRRAASALLVLAAIMLLTGGFAASAPQAAALSSTVVISQVYGGGGNVGAPYRNDYVELLNRGTTTVSLTGWSVQYASATGAGTFASNPITLLGGSLEPGQYYLVQMASSGSNGTPLPSPDASGSASMSATGGKVVLVNTTTGLACNGGSSPCSPEQLSMIVDLIGWGSADFYEGAPGPATMSTTAALRNSDGCAETDDNAADFSAGAPTPRNTSSLRCSPPAISDQPADQTVDDGQQASFSAAASGRPAPSVKWQTSADGGASWDDVPGATATTLAFTAAAAQDGARYRAVFTNALGSATSEAATLTVNVAPAKLRTQALRAFGIRRGRRATFRFRVLYAPPAGQARAYRRARVVLKIRDSHGRSRLSRTFSRSLLNRVHNYTIPHCHLKKGTYRYFIYATLPDGQKQQRIGSARFVVR